MGRITRAVQVWQVRPGSDAQGGVVRRPDRVAVEEPLEIRVGGTPITVTMRTPGHDVELATGLLVSEGVITTPDEVRTAMHCASDAEPNTYNVLDLQLAPEAALRAAALTRSLISTSACGLCGKDSIEAITSTSRLAMGSGPRLTPSMLSDAFVAMRTAQETFERTGGTHAAGLLDVSSGELLVVREDVGRHNAVDKVVGWALNAGRLPSEDAVLLVSGRGGFELVQKAVMAGIGVLASVSAPSSLAVELATESGLTLIGFARGESMNVYSHPSRLIGVEEVADLE